MSTSSTCISRRPLTPRLVYDGHTTSISDHAIVATDIEGRIWTHAEIQGQDISSAHLHELREASTFGRAVNERYHIRKDGARFYCSGVISSIRAARGDVVGYVKVAQDLTVQRRQAQTLGVPRDDLLASRDALRQELAERTFAEQRVRNLLARLVSLQEEERRRIARDLHDNVGQQMTALHLGKNNRVAFSDATVLAPEAQSNLTAQEIWPIDATRLSCGTGCTPAV